MGKLVLVDVSVAVCVCTLAIQTAGSGMLFSLARVGVIPSCRNLGRISSRRATPVLPDLVLAGPVGRADQRGRDGLGGVHLHEH